MAKGFPTACLMALNPLSAVPVQYEQASMEAQAMREPHTVHKSVQETQMQQAVYRSQTQVSGAQAIDHEDGSRTLKLTVHCAPDKRLLMLEKFTLEKTEKLDREQDELATGLTDLKSWVEGMKRDHAEHIEAADKNFSNIATFLAKFDATSKSHTKSIESLEGKHAQVLSGLEALQKQCDGDSAQLLAHNGQIAELENLVEGHGRQLASLRTDVASVQQRLQMLADDFVAVEDFELLKDQVELQDKKTLRFVEELSAQLAAATARISALESTCAELEEQAVKPCAVLGERLAEVQNQQSDLEARVGEVELAAATLGDRVDSEAKRTAAVTEEVHGLGERVEGEALRTSAVAKDVSDVASALNGVASDLSGVTTDVTALTKAVRVAEQAHENLADRVLANEKNIAVIDESMRKMNKTVGVMGQRLVQMATNVNQGCAAVLTEA